MASRGMLMVLRTSTAAAAGARPAVVTVAAGRPAACGPRRRRLPAARPDRLARSLAGRRAPALATRPAPAALTGDDQRVVVAQRRRAVVTSESATVMPLRTSTRSASSSPVSIGRNFALFSAVIVKTPRLPSKSTTRLRDQRGVLAARRWSAHARVHAGLEAEVGVRAPRSRSRRCASPDRAPARRGRCGPLKVSPGKASTSTRRRTPTLTSRRSFSTTLATSRTELMSTTDTTGGWFDAQAPGSSVALADEAVHRRA